MKRFMTVACLAPVIAMTLGCNRQNDRAVDAQAIQNIEKQCNQDLASKDVDKLAAYYAEDAVLMTPRMAPVVGRESIRAMLRQMAADPSVSLKFTTAKIDVADSGDLAYSRGAYVMTMTDPLTKKVLHDQGSYVTTYRKDADGKWKAVADISSSEVTPVQAGAL